MARARQFLAVRNPPTAEDVEDIRGSDLFDAQWYLITYPDVVRTGLDAATHYARFGAAEGRDPGPLFSTDDYLALNPDVEATYNALLHYVRWGRFENRLVRPLLADPPSRRVPAPQIGIITGEPRRQSSRAATLATALHPHAGTVAVLDCDEAGTNLWMIRRLDTVIISNAPAGKALDAVIATTSESGGLLICDYEDLTIDPETADIDELRGIRTELATAAELRIAHEGRSAATAAAVCATATTSSLAEALRSSGTPTFVVPDGFDDETFVRARRLASGRSNDDVVRIGLAARTDVPLSDFGVAAKALAAVLARHQDCRLVILADRGVPVVDLEGCPELGGVESQIERRSEVPTELLPGELARFDIAIAPLEVGNRYRDSQSPRPFVDAALVDAPIVASPTPPFREIIDDGVNGFLAHGADEWESVLERLVVDRDLREAVGRRASRTALAEFGPRRRAVAIGSALDYARGLHQSTTGAAVRCDVPRVAYPSVDTYRTTTVRVAVGDRDVSVAILVDGPVDEVDATLRSIVEQSLPALDVVVVASVDREAATEGMNTLLSEIAPRFTKLTLVQCDIESASLRDVAFDAAETPYVLSLRAGDRLAAAACDGLVGAIKDGQYAFAWAAIDSPGTTESSFDGYDRVLLPGGVRRPAVTMIAKEAWAAAGGFVEESGGEVHRDIWVRLLELGLTGTMCGDSARADEQWLHFSHQ